MKTVILALLAFALVGCATSAPEPAERVEWVGMSEAEMVAKMGAPHNVYETDEGLKVVSFKRESDVFDHVVGEVRTFRCEISFMVENSVIVGEKRVGDCG